MEVFNKVENKKDTNGLKDWIKISILGVILGWQSILGYWPIAVFGVAISILSIILCNKTNKKGLGISYIGLFLNLTGVIFSIFFPMKINSTKYVISEIIGVFIVFILPALVIWAGILLCMKAYYKAGNNMKRTKVNKIENEPLMPETDNLYVMYNKCTGDRIPTIDSQGYAWVFTKKEYAENIIRKNAGIDLAYKEYSQEEFYEYVKRWYGYGVIRFILNAGTSESKEINRDDLFPNMNMEDVFYSGSDINQLMIRYKQNSANRNVSKLVLQWTATWWNFLCHKFKESVFFVPVTFDDEVEIQKVSDYEIHATVGAVQLIAEMREKRQIEKNKVCRFYAYGSEKYSFAQSASDKKMHIITVLTGTHTFIPAFTDIATLHRVYGENTRVGLWTYDELTTLAKETEGIVFNPSEVGLILTCQDFKNVEEINKGPMKMYVGD